MTIQLETTGQWDVALRMTAEMATSRSYLGWVKTALRREAQDSLRRIRGFFASGGPPGAKWAKLSDLSMIMRRNGGFGGSKVLIRTGDLRASLNITEQDGTDAYTLFIGVKRSAPRANLAVIHEFGKTFSITVTRKMQRYIMAILSKHQKSGRDAAGRFRGKGDTGGAKGPSSGNFRVGASLTIRIPARPFIGPEAAYLESADGKARIQAGIESWVARKLGEQIANGGGATR